MHYWFNHKHENKKAPRICLHWDFMLQYSAAVSHFRIKTHLAQAKVAAIEPGGVITACGVSKCSLGMFHFRKSWISWEIPAAESQG